MKTRQYLIRELAAAHKTFVAKRAQDSAHIVKLVDELATASAERGAALEDAGQLRKHLDELKARLADAESENQRMRGYLERVQEDDVVREELIPTGDPQGAQQLVPKRKPTIFAPQTYRSNDQQATSWRSEPTPPPRHWVTY